MNQIQKAQNDPRNLERLAAQRHLYSRAKRILGWQIIVGGPLAVVAAVVMALAPDAKGIVVFWCVTVAVADLAWLTPWQKTLRLSAATIQEQFDCDVLVLPWNELTIGAPPLPEVVAEAAKGYAPHSKAMPELTDWYPRAVNALPLALARILCQRENCWWDETQRRRYLAAIYLAIATVTIVVFAIAIPSGLSIDAFLARVAAPLLPALILGWRHTNEQKDAANTLDRLRGLSEKLWAEAIAGTPHHILAQRSRILQDEIFDSRKRSPPVFDFVFRHLRHENETMANAGVESLVRQALERQPSGESLRS